MFSITLIKLKIKPISTFYIHFMNAITIRLISFKFNWLIKPIWFNFLFYIKAAFFIFFQYISTFSVWNAIWPLFCESIWTEKLLPHTFEKYDFKGNCDRINSTSEFGAQWYLGTRTYLRVFATWLPQTRSVVWGEMTRLCSFLLAGLSTVTGRSRGGTFCF